MDRDGVLNVDKSYLYKIEDLEWIDGAKEALAYLTKKGYTIFVVTNQSGIARGYYTIGDMQKLHNYMAQQIAEAGGKIEKFLLLPASSRRRRGGVRRGVRLPQTQAGLDSACF